jgi:hypothetical protein
MAPGTLPFVLYPNPSHGQPVSLVWPGLTTSIEIRVQIYTLAFRLVRAETVTLSPASPILTIDLVDNWNNPLANGLYYVVLNGPQGRQILKLLVLR